MDVRRYSVPAAIIASEIQPNAQDAVDPNWSAAFFFPSLSSPELRRLPKALQIATSQPNCGVFAVPSNDLLSCRDQSMNNERRKLARNAVWRSA